MKKILQLLTLFALCFPVKPICGQNLLTVNIEYWRETSWHPNALYIYSYDSKSNCTQKLDQTWNVLSQIWVNHANTSYQYDLLGNVISEVNQYNITPNTCSNTSKSIRTYTFVNKVLNKTGFSWDGSQWDSTTRIFNEYDNGGILKKSTTQQRPNNNISWANYMQQVYTVDGNGLVAQENMNLWNNADLSWNNLSRYTYTYTPIGKIKSKAGQSWYNSTWNDDFTVTWTYDGAGKQKYYVSKRTNKTTGLENADSVCFTYLLSGQQFQTIYYRWDTGKSQWIPDRRDTYYFEGFPTGLTENSDKKIQTFPNPFTDVVNVIADNEERLVLTDMSGREIKNFVFSPGINKLHLHELQPGMYLLQSRSGTIRIVKE